MIMVGLATNVIPAMLAAILVGGGLSVTVVAMLTRVRRKQRSLASILDDTMGDANLPVEVISETPPHTETSALSVRLSQSFGRLDTRGVLEQRLERAAIPLRSGEYIVMTAVGALVFGFI